MSEQLPHDEELRSLYRKLPADQPRAELDDAILTAARRRNVVERRRMLIRRLRWTIPMAAAAGVVLTLTLTRLTPEQLASPAAFAPNPAALAVPQKLPEGSLAGSEKMRDEAAPVAQPDDIKALGSLSDAAPAASDSQAAGNNALVLDRSPARKDAAPTMAKKAAGPKGAERAAPRDAVSAPAVAPPTPALSDQALASAPALATAPPPPAPKTEAAYAEAAPPQAASPDPEAAPAEAARAKSRALGQMAQMASALEAKELDAVDAWPFGLEAGLGAQEACRRVHEALHRDCEFRAGLVDLPLDPVATIDRGPHAGASVSRLTLALHDDKLWSVVLALPLPDGTTEQVALIARDSAPVPKP